MKVSKLGIESEILKRAGVLNVGVRSRSLDPAGVAKSEGMHARRPHERPSAFKTNREINGEDADYSRVRFVPYA